LRVSAGEALGASRKLDDDSRMDIFVHVRDCEHEVPLAVGDRVSFVRKMQSDGRVRARKVRVEE
jgi:cold shock CspA family protein